MPTFLRPPILETTHGTVAHYVWEPGDATRYEFFITTIPPERSNRRTRRWVTLFIGGCTNGSTELPDHVTEAPIAPEYLASKTGLGAYEASVMSDLLAFHFNTPPWPKE